MIPSRYVVDVRNGSNGDGLGGQAMALLRGQGFLRGTLDTAGTVDESVVNYTGSDGDAAEQLAAHLGGIATAEADEGVSPGTCRWCSAPTSTAPCCPRTQARPPPPAPLAASITAAGVPCVD